MEQAFFDKYCEAMNVFFKFEYPIKEKYFTDVNQYIEENTLTKNLSFDSLKIFFIVHFSILCILSIVMIIEKIFRS